MRCLLKMAVPTLAAIFLAGEAPAASPTRPNVLLIMTDQQSADALSCRMGTQYLNTPAMDSLAASGTFFTRAYSANPLCMPSRTSMFTGRWPHETGVTTNEYRALNPTEFRSLGTYFHNAGYRTAYFGKWHLALDEKDLAAHGLETMDLKQKHDPDHAAADGAVRFLSQKHDRPFLLVVSFLNPHNICQYARRMAGMPGQSLNCGEVGNPPPLEELPPAPANWAVPENEPDSMTLIRKGYHVDPRFPVAHFTESMWRQHRWGYYRMIEKVDAEMGRVLTALRQAGLEETTLVVFTSDHGECAGAHRFNQKTVFYEESARVPLIVSVKGRTRPGVCDRLVSTGVDILPTLLEVAGIAIPKNLPGRSLQSLALGHDVSGWRDYVVSQNNLYQTAAVGGILPAAEGRMVRTDRYKYCLYSRGIQRESLVDLKQDPGEMKDLARDPGHRRVLEEHRSLLAKFAEEQGDTLAGEMLADDVPPRPFTPSPPH